MIPSGVMTPRALPVAVALLAACDPAVNDTPGDASVARADASVALDRPTPAVDVPPVPDGPAPMPVMPACRAAASGRATAMAPQRVRALRSMGGEGWLGSPAVVDLDRDGRAEVVAARGPRVVVWGADGAMRWSAAVNGRERVWAAPLVGDFAGDASLEVAAAAGDAVALFDAGGTPSAGFPVRWRDELRSLAGGDLDGDGRPEIVAASTEPLRGAPARDLLMAWHGNGSAMAGYPPNMGGGSGCDDHCYVTGGFDQNLAVGYLDDDRAMDVVAPMDNAYVSWHRGSGEAFRVSSMFRGATRSPGVRFLHDMAEARQGYSERESTSNQAHFTNTPPTLADVDGDGRPEIVMVASVQNASQDDRRRGVALWAVHADGTRPAGWETPLHVPTYLAGLEDLGGNIVGITNQVSAAELDPSAAGPELLFAGYDGRVHCAGSDRRERWSYAYTTDARVLTAGVAVADLSGDGRPEVILATYGTQASGHALLVLGADGALQQRVALPGRGAMAVPTVGDVDGDGALEVVVSLKDDGGDEVLVFTVPGSSTNCVQWPTGRANWLRSGVPSA